jgi:HK97 family phage portal protein
MAKKKKQVEAPEIRSAITDGYGQYTGSFALPTLAGTTVTTETSLTIAAVWQAVNIYANTIAALPRIVGERDRRGGHSPAYDHPLFDLVHIRPNRISTSFRFWQTVISHALTFGNSYSEITSKDGYATDLHLLDPKNIHPHMDEKGELFYHFTREKIDVPASKILHIAGLGFDGIKGYSPIHMARDILGLAIAQNNYQSSLMGNNAQPTGYLEYPNTLRDDQKGRLRDSWNKIHQGSERSGNLAILDGGIKWVATSFSPVDQQLILSLQWSVSQVARLFNLPPHMLGQMDSATFGNIEEQNIQFYQMSLLPWLENIEQELNVKLLPREDRRDFVIKHEVRSLLRGNLAAQTAYNTAMFNMGAVSINEIRLSEGDIPLDDPGADKHWVPTNNLTAIEDMGKTIPIPVIKLDPDDDLDETEVKPEEDEPERLPPGALDSVRALVLDPVGRMVRREILAARTASKKPDFREWISAYYRKHEPLITESIEPALRTLAIIEGKSHDPEGLARVLAKGSREALDGLAVCVPPDELPEAVERLTATWLEARSDEAKRWLGN